MKVHIRDRDALRAISPDALSAYARAAGWSRTNERYRVHSDVYAADGLPEIILPRTRRLGDYASVVARLIEIFSTVTERDQLALYHDLVNTNCDVVRVRAGGHDDGSLTVNDGVDLVVGARDMLLAAACSLREPQARYRAGANKEAADLLSRVRLGQTEQGSFVVALMISIPSEDYDPPIERRMTRRLIESLDAARSAAESAVAGFKSIRALEDFELRGLNVLVGANGAGKSNLMSLFRMVSELAAGRLQLFVKREGRADALLFGGRRRTSVLDVELSFNGNSHRYGFSLEPVADGLAFAREHVVPGESTCSGHLEAQAVSIEVGDFAAYVLPVMRDWRVYHFHDTSEVAGVRCPQAVRDNLRLLHERHPHEYREIVDAVRLAAPFFGGFVYRRDVDELMELEWHHVDDADTPLGPLQLSDGTLRFMCLATLLLQPTAMQPRLILIDEPELGLHPVALTLLAEMLLSASEARQVIVSTQSADLVSEFRPEDVVVVDRRDGESIFERLDLDRLQDWLKEYSLGQLWKANVIGGGPAR